MDITDRMALGDEDHIWNNQVRFWNELSCTVISAAADWSGEVPSTFS